MVRQSERSGATIGAVLDAARKLFAAQGFEATSIDAIAARAGVAKGAVYHHFASKDDVFAQVFEAASAELAAQIPAEARKGKDPLDRIARGTLKYLTGISGPPYRRILLIDGPVVLGWQRWREADQRHFGSLMQAPHLIGRLNARETQALGHLLTGAMTEAALICATADNPARTARDLTTAFIALLTGLVRAP
jgi:AcrR family transcriptional regulator